MKKNSLKEIVLVSSMFFGMLFGAGNLIFPVSMGQRAGAEVFVATLGFCITGVGLPLLSVLALSSSNSASVTDMVKLVGKKFSIYDGSLPLYRTAFRHSQNSNRSFSGRSGSVFTGRY